MAANGSAARAWGEQLGSARRRLQTVNSLRSLRSIQTPPPKKKPAIAPIAWDHWQALLWSGFPSLRVSTSAANTRLPIRLWRR